MEVDSIKRKLLVKYPSFGSTIAKLEFKVDEGIPTAATDGKAVLYNPKFLEGLSEKQQVFLFAHEVCHVKFDHIFRSEGKDKRLWNIATDSVINALLQQDGLEMIEGGVDVPEAEKFSADDMYEKLLEEKKKQEEEQQNNQQGGKGQSGLQDQSKEGESKEQSNSQKQSQEGESKGQSSQEEQGKGENGQGEEQQEENQNVGHDSHDLWDKAIEERKKEQEEQKEEGKGQQDSEEVNERKEFEQNREERKRRLDDFSKGLAKIAAGKGKSSGERILSDIGIAKPLIDWRKLLKQATKYEEEWTRKNARMRGGYFRHRLEQIPVPESEILLDVSGSVSETLLKNFLRECKNILDNSRVKVGCFDTEFYGFTELKKPEDIDNMTFPIGGGTDFDVAVNAFSRRATNKIIFTDGEAYMPKKEVKGVIWVVFGDREINPKGGKVINIRGEQLRRLYQNYIKDNTNER